MVIQSRRVWISGQFLEAALKVEDGKIVQIYPYGTVKADVDYCSGIYRCPYPWCLWI